MLFQSSVNYVSRDFSFNRKTGYNITSVYNRVLAFGFKLQAVFLLPIMAVLWFRGNYKLWHFALFPVFYVALVLPAVTFDVKVAVIVQVLPL